MGFDQDGNQAPQPELQPEPRRKTSSQAGGMRFEFRPTEQKKTRRALKAEDESAAFHSDFGPRAMRPDGSPAAPPRKPAKPVRHTRKKSKLLPAAFSALLAAVLGLLAYAYWMDPGRSNVFFEGVYVGGVHLGGMTQEQASQALADAQAQILADWRVSLRYEGTERSVLADDIAMQLNMGEQLAAAWKLGREGGYAERRRAVDKLKREPYYAAGGVSYDAALLEITLDHLRASIDSEPVDASAVFSPENEQPFQYTDEIYGKRLNVEALRAQVDQYALTLQSADITLEPEQVPPKVTRAALQENLTCIVVVTTDIHSTSTEGRNQNIRIALGRLNGLMVASYDRLSFNQVAGKRSDPQNGYQEALEIAYGEYVTGIGGGVCQVSSTLYQAALRAGLQVIDRSAHAIPSNYADRGQDATVSDNGSDLVFRNNTDYPIYIRARLTESGDKGKRKRCEIAVYGRPLPDDTRYTLETRQIGADIQPEPEKEYIADKDAKYVTYTDQQKEHLSKRLGYRVETFLVKLRADGMEVSRERISEDLYKPRPAQIYVGVTPRN